MTYRIPSPNMLNSAARVANGACKFQIIGSGRAKTQRSVTRSRTQDVIKIVDSLGQLPLCISECELYANGRHIKKATKMTIIPQHTTNAITIQQIIRNRRTLKIRR